VHVGENIDENTLTDVMEKKKFYWYPSETGLILMASVSQKAILVRNPMDKCNSVYRL
jgi:hypothetical protein